MKSLTTKVIYALTCVLCLSMLTFCFISCNNEPNNGDDNSSNNGSLRFSESSSGITISWNRVSRADGYDIYRGEGNDSYEYYDNINDSEATSYTDYDVISGRTYYYRVAAYNYNSEQYIKYFSGEIRYSATSDYGDNGGDNGNGNEGGDGGGTSSAPSTPTGLTATASSSSIVLSWNAISNADLYYIYRSTSAYSGYIFLASSYSTRYTDSSASTGTKYYYKVSAKNDAGESEISDYVYATISSSNSGNNGGDNGGGNSGGDNGGSSVSKPSAPTGLTGKAGGNASVGFYIDLEWDYNSSVDKCYVYHSTSRNGSYSKIGNGYYNYRHENPSNGTNYYKISAVNSAGEGPKSDAIEVVMDKYAFKPQFQSVKGSISGSDVKVTWSTKSGEGYGKPEKVVAKIKDPNDGSIQSKEFTGSSAQSGSTSWPCAACYKDEYGRISIQVVVSNEYGENSHNVTYAANTWSGNF